MDLAEAIPLVDVLQSSPPALMVRWVSLGLAVAVHLTMTAGHVCSGPCICIDDGGGLQVDCSRKHLAGIPTSQADWPPELRVSTPSATLRFQNNAIAHVDSFPDLPAVLSLSLQRNVIESIQDGAFAHMERLELLDLSHNKLTGSDIRANIFKVSSNTSGIASPRLLLLDLGYNNISHLPAESLGSLQNLQELRLNNNPLLCLEKSIQKALHALNHLQVIDLSSTSLSYIGESFYNSPAIKGSLREIHLAGNLLTEVPKSFSIIGSTLEILNLNGNPIVELNDTSFVGLNNVRKLWIGEMSSLFRIAPGTFDSLETLQTLFCSSNPQLSDIDKDAFRELKNKWPIKEIYLNNNSLESMSAELLPWKEVDLLDIRDNPWSCDCRLSWFPELLAPVMRNGMEMVARRSYCVRPQRWSGVALVDVPADEQVWCSEESAVITDHGTSTSLALLAIALSVLTALAICILCTKGKLFALLQPMNQSYVLVRQ